MLVSRLLSSSNQCPFLRSVTHKVANRLNLYQTNNSRLRPPAFASDYWIYVLTQINLYRNAVSVNQQLLTIDEVATNLKVSRATIYRLISRGYLQRIKVGSSARFTERSVEQLIRRLETESREQEVGF
jgi:excisionase family DNA binding protein